MITIWKTPIVATVEQVLKDLKLQLYGAGLLKEIKNTGSDLMCTCPFHANGKEHNPSCGVLLQQKVTKADSSTMEINVAKQKQYLESIGVDTSEMDEQAIKEANTGSHVFLKGTISILDAIEDVDIFINKD